MPGLRAVVGLRHQAQPGAAQAIERRPLQAQQIGTLKKYLASFDPAVPAAVSEELIRYGRLAASGLADQTQGLAATDCETHAVQHAQPAFAMPVGNIEVGDLDEGGCSRHLSATHSTAENTRKPLRE
jgi:hypothetical protein